MSSALPPGSTPSTERTPLLPSSSPTSSPPAGTNSDDAPIPELTPHERLVSTLRWVAFWFLFSVLVGVLVVKAVKEGGGEVDWWGALKKAGGGVSFRSSKLYLDAGDADDVEQKLMGLLIESWNRV